MAYELEQIKEFIRSELKKGYDLETIKKTLHSSGFPKAEIKEALATLHKKTTPKEESEPIKIEKPKGPGFFSRLFAKRKKKEIKKPKQQGALTRFFFKEVPAKKQIEKIEPKIPLPKPAEPQKQKKPWFFSRILARKPVKKEITVAKPVIKKPKKHIRFPKITLPKIRLPRIKIPYLKRITATTFLITFFIAVGVIIWAFPASCATDTCFINKANQCKAATFSNIIEGTTLKYETNNCVLKKTIISTAPDEIPEITNEFQGKSMLCIYKKNDFSPIYINTISGMLNTCEGELREVIQKYII